MYNEEPYRSCPVCRTKLSKKMDYKAEGVKWRVYSCKNCGSEIFIDPFKELRKRFGK